MTRYRIVELRNGTFSLQKRNGCWPFYKWSNRPSNYTDFRVLDSEGKERYTPDGAFSVWYSKENAIAEMQLQIAENKKERERQNGLKVKKIYYPN